MRVYAIGDIHGQLGMLRAAHDRIAADRNRVSDDGSSPVVHLGDYTDRGPDSKGVIDFLIEGRNSGAHWIFLGFVRDGAARDGVLRSDLTWLSDNMGGRDTLASYGVTRQIWTSHEKLRSKAIEAIPSAHVAFLEDLQLSFETPDLFFCHAGVRPGVALADQVEDDLIWIRSPFLEHTGDFGKIIVHGHTPVSEPENFGNRIDLDTGAGYGRAMTAAVFEGRDCFVLTDEGRTLLPPMV